MNAIKKIRRYMEANVDQPSSRILASLAVSLADEGSFPLGELYKLDYDAFQLAIDLLKDWRLDRYYAARLKLMDVALNEVLQKQAPAVSE